MHTCTHSLTHTTILMTWTTTINLHCSADLAIQLIVAFLSVIIGMMTFAGSMVAVAKLTPKTSLFHINAQAKTFAGRDLLLIVLCLGKTQSILLSCPTETPFEIDFAQLSN